MICLSALVAGVAFVLWNTLLNEAPPSPPQTLRDGVTTIALTASRTGRKIEFRHGTFKEKFFDFLLPERGFKIGKRLYLPPKQVVKLEAPNDRLFLEFQFTRPGATSVRIISIATPSSGGPVWGSGGGQGNSFSLSAPASRSTSVVGHTTFTTIYTSPRSTGPTGPSTTVTIGTNVLLTLGGVLPSGRTTVPIAGTFPGAAPVLFTVSSGAIYPSGEFRMVLSGDDGFEYIEPFWPQGGRFTNGYVYVQAAMYPRQSRVVNVRIEQREAVLEPWQTVANFQTRVSPQSTHWWSAEKSPIRKTRDNFAFVLGEVSVRNATPPNELTGKYEAFIPFQVLENGHPLTNWEAFPLLGEDAGGNATPIGSFKTLSNGWLNLQSMQILNPSQVWRFRTSFGRVSDFPPASLVSLTLPLPFTPGTPGALTTNLLGVPVTIRADGSSLHFELPASRTDLRLNIVSAHWPDGSENTGDGFRWNERHVGIDYSSRPAAGPLKLTLAIHPNYPIEFFVQPINRISKK